MSVGSRTTENCLLGVTLLELQLAVHQTLDCIAGALIEIVGVKVRRVNGTVWEGNVHVLEISDYPDAERCYAWLEIIDERRLTIRVIPHSAEADTATKAVQVAHRES